MNKKSLYDISWQVTEPEYRADKALSYSTLSRYQSQGFSNLAHIFDSIESPSLTFGSAVDAYITGGKDEFDALFMTAEFPKLEDSVLQVVKELFNKYHTMYSTLDNIPTDSIITTTEELNYQARWRPETRAKVIREKGAEYYNLLFIAQDKTVLDTDTYNDVMASVRALKEDVATKFYFADNDPFDNKVERFYQLKFKATLNNVDYRCMADLILVDYQEKKIYPVDLKTSSLPEWEFHKSFIKWHYQIQARLYWRIIKDNIERDPYFKDFELMDYTFIVVNRNTLTPLRWTFDMTRNYGTLTIKTDSGEAIVFPDPEFLGKELYHYLNDAPKVPDYIIKHKSNNLLHIIKSTL